MRLSHSLFLSCTLFSFVLLLVVVPFHSLSFFLLQAKSDGGKKMNFSAATIKNDDTENYTMTIRKLSANTWVNLMAVVSQYTDIYIRIYLYTSVTSILSFSLSLRAFILSVAVITWLIIISHITPTTSLARQLNHRQCV